MSRSFLAIIAATAAVAFLPGCSTGPANKQEVCDQFDELGRQVLTANGLIDNLVFSTADDLADVADRYTGPENLSADATKLADIADSSSTTSAELTTATDHIADLCGHRLGTNSLFDTKPRQNSGNGGASVPTHRAPAQADPPAPTSPAPTSTGTDTPTGSAGSAQPAGYRRVDGPAGLSVEIPTVFQSTSSPSAANRQAANPADPDLFVRFGGSPAPKSTLLAEIEAGERTNPNVRNGYQRIQLTSVSFLGTAAVDWEFTFVKDGITRHAYGRYWRAGKTGYVIYASASDNRWHLIQPVFEHMLSTAVTPA